MGIFKSTLIVACLISTVGTTPWTPSNRSAFAFEKINRSAHALTQAYYDHVSFIYDSSLADVVTGRYVPAEASGLGQHPAYILFQFGHYILHNLPKYKIQANLSVFPLTRSNGDFAPGGVAQLLTARTHDVPFRNGSGTSYLAAYAQNYVVVTNDLPVVYVFSGKTREQRFQVSLTLPLHISALPNHPSGSYPASYEQYKLQLVKELNALPDSAFTPRLSSLDALVRSILANPSLVAPATVTMYVNTAQLNGTGANLRAHPDAQSSIRAFIPNGAAVQAALKPVTGIDGKPWYKVSYKGKTGYVLGQLLSSDTP